MRGPDILASPSIREEFEITGIEMMATHCTTIAAEHSESTVEEINADDSVCVDPAVGEATETLGIILGGTRLPLHQSNPISVHSHSFCTNASTS